MRRNAIIAYRQGRGKLSSTKIKNMAYSYGAERVEVSFNKNNCALEVEMIFKDGIYLELNMLLEIIEELKPARLMINYKTVLEKESSFYIGATAIGGEQVTVYPWTTTEIKESGSLFYALGHQAVEKITVYPKEVE